MTASSVRVADAEKNSILAMILTSALIFLPLGAFVYAIVSLWHRAVTWLDIGLLVGFYVPIVLGVTIGFHRLFTHRSFKTVPFVRLVLLVFGSFSIEGSPLLWCHFHREHHQHSDTKQDIHSPHNHNGGFWGVIRGFLHAHFGWLLTLARPKVKTKVSDLLQDRMVVLVSRYYVVFVFLSIALPWLLGYLITRDHSRALQALIWAGGVRIFLIHHVTWSTNSICHLWGRRTYETTDQSRDNRWLAIPSLGEAHHNTHHAFPSSARHGLRRWQIDISWIVIWLLSKIGLVWAIRLPSESEREEKRISK